MWSPLCTARGLKGLATLLLVLACLPVSALATAFAGGGHYIPRHWDMRDGLPHNQVHAITQDAQGYIWAVTWEGVVRYNGRQFTVFDFENTGGIKLNGVFAVLGEADGSILVGTAYDGIWRYQHGRWQAVGDAISQRTRIDNLLRSQDGTLWASSRERLLRLDAQGRLEDVGSELGLDASHIRHLYEHDGALLLSTVRGAWRLENGRLSHWGQEAGFADRPVRQILSDGQGGWVVACDDGMWRWSGRGPAQRVPGSERVMSILRDARGNLWSSYAHGDVVRDGPDGSRQVLHLGGMTGQVLYGDRDGLVWLGNANGLYQLAPGVVRTYTQADGLGDDYVRVVMQTDDDVVWVGHGDGMVRWDRGGMQTVQWPQDGTRSRTITALAARAGSTGIWAGTFEQGVLRFAADGSLLEQRPVQVDSQRSMMVRSLLDTPHGLLAGTPVGLMRVHAEYTERFGKQLGLPEDSVQVLSQDAAGTVWIGTDAGFATLAPDGTLAWWSPLQQLPAQSVFDFLHDPDGTVWMATDSGVVRLRDGQLTRYGHAAGLPREKVFRILDDGAGHLWLSSNRGVFRVARSAFEAHDRDRSQLLAVDVVDRSDGLPGSQVNGATWPAGWRHRDGQLLFPTGMGLVAVDPALAGRNRQAAPQVLLEQVSVNGENLPLQADYRFTAPTTRLSISYVALALATPHKVRYRYRLDGFDTDWVDADEGNEAVYTNLPPGRYRFQVQAMVLPLDWVNHAAVGQAELLLEQVPAWWNRPRVFAGLVIGAMLLLALWARLRSLHYHRQQQRLNALVAQRTAELHEQNLALAQAGREREQLMQRLEHQALHDALTDLPNRRAADAYLQHALSAAQNGIPLAVALIDVDHFKQVNDRHGHEVGDRLLSHLGHMLAAHCGGDVFAARQGGEEFLVVIQGLEHDQALERMRSLCAAVAESRYDALPPCTVSIGLASWGPGQDSVRTLLAVADRHLYRAKEQGRNQVVG